MICDIVIDNGGLDYVNTTQSTQDPKMLSNCADDPTLPTCQWCPGSILPYELCETTLMCQCVSTLQP